MPSRSRRQAREAALRALYELEIGRGNVQQALRDTIENTDLRGRVIPLVEPEYLIGRHRDNTLQLSDPGISGFHARLYLGPEGYVVEDLKSRNGVWVNGTRVFHATLQSGDVVHIGQTDLRFEVLFNEQ